MFGDGDFKTVFWFLGIVLMIVGWGAIEGVIYVWDVWLRDALAHVLSR